MSIYPYLCALVLLLSGCSTLKHSPAVTFDSNHISHELKTLVDQKDLVGVSALVYQNHREVYFGAFGDADREQKRAMTRATRAQIFSMTKPITGVALMTLYEQGRFKFDDPIEQYLPEFAHLKVYAGKDDKGELILVAPKRKPTILDLCRHTAGFGSDMEGQPLNDVFKKELPENLEQSLQTYIQKLSQLPLISHPGERWFYGPSVDVQAYLIERLSGMAFEDYLQKYVFNPLKMYHTSHVLKPEEVTQSAALYDWKAPQVFSPSNTLTPTLKGVNHRFKTGSAGLFSTLDDYMRFARMLLNQGELDGVRILKPASVAWMTQNHMPGDVTDTLWLPSKGQVGFGVDVAVRIKPPQSSAEASGEVGEFFWDGYANTLFWVDPKHKITAVFFTQYIPFGKVPAHKIFRDSVYLNIPSAKAPAAPSQ